MATFTDRLVELRDLIPFGQVGIEVVLSSESIETTELTTCSEAEHDGEFNDPLIGYRQCSW